MSNGSLDLSSLLPNRMRDKTIDSLLKNLFNRHLSKSNTVSLFGYVGDKLHLEPGEVQVEESNVERKINQLVPFIYAEHASEKHTYDWTDLINSLLLMGVKYENLKDWLKSNSYNFVPPIDLDKFCNFQEYYWIGTWILNAPAISYVDLGVVDPTTYAIPKFSSWGNSNLDPEYYVIKKGEISNLNPVSTQPDIGGWSDWAYSNLWIHRDDAVSFLQSRGGAIGFEDLIQATRPIIEYSDKVGLNVYQSVLGVPSNHGVLVGQYKTSKNQLPLFDLYLNDGTHAGVTSSIFFYKEGQEYGLDSVIGRRIAVDSNNDFIFSHSLTSADKSLYFYRNYTDVTHNKYVYDTIWKRGPEVSVKYQTYDTSGTLIDQDKFTNFKNYYWTGVDNDSHESYNAIGEPEYVMIAKGGTSDWSKYNFWTHVSNLRRSEIKSYVQAIQPIIEFNLLLEDELISQKTSIGELPRFKHYLKNSTDTYSQIVDAFDPNLNDGYLAGTLFAKVADLSGEIQSVLSLNNDLKTNTFIFNDETYIQGLFTGGYYPSSNGTLYGYKSRNIDYGLNNVTIISTGSAVPQILTFEYLGADQFRVRGSVSGDLGTIPTDQQVEVAGIVLHLASGEDYAIGDKSAIEVLSYVYERKNLYVKIGDNYRTISSPELIYKETQSSYLVESDPSRADGAWSIPPQLEWNVKNETRTDIKQGDIYFHLISIIESQNGLVGSSSGNNNVRNLTVDLGLGGTIKQYDGNFALLTSLLIQEGLTVNSLLEFMQTSYQSLSTAIRSFVENEVPSLLHEGKFSPPLSGDSVDPLLVAEFKKYFSGLSNVTLNTSSTVDDLVSSPFYDSTSSLFNLIITLPYLGMSTLLRPAKLFDYQLNLAMLRHHDGHRTELQTFPVDLAKKITVKSFKRYPGQETPGIIGGLNYPQKPYKCQFWFKMTNAKLYFYDVVSDEGVLEESVAEGKYSYDRSTDSLWRKESSGWVYVNDLSLPWTELKLDLILQNLELAIETELYVNCPPLSQRIDLDEYIYDPLYVNLMKKEFETFGVKYGVVDVYAVSFDSNNPFTWNYSSAFGGEGSSWQNAYTKIYGTNRPDLFPWFSTGYSSEAEFLSAVIAENLIPSNTTKFIPSTMWPFVATFVRNKQIIAREINKLSVDISTGTLIPPYKSGHAESILLSPPVSANYPFEFGSNGPVEMFWKRTLDYQFAKQKTYFKINPLKYVSSSWGYKENLTNEYAFDSVLGRKLTPADFKLHGEELNELAQLSWCAVEPSPIRTSLPSAPYSYTFKCVSRNDGVFKVFVSSKEMANEITGTDELSEDRPWFVRLNMPGEVRNSKLQYYDKYAKVELTPTIRGFFWGDTFKVDVDAEGNVTATVIPQTYYKFEGLNQVYVQYGRVYGEDSQISINQALLKNWNIKLGYRFGGMVNTDSLRIKTQSTTIDESAFSVFLKENKFYDSSWLDSIRVQLVQRGSATLESGYNVPSKNHEGVPGEDWVFRVDTYNNKRPTISWYEYDLDGEFYEFVALNGKRTYYPWKRYTSKKAVRSYSTPFLITGIQNVVNFIVGYADKMEDEGWRFNDTKDPIIDSESGRHLGYQLLIEAFIVQQFSNVDAGSAYVFNPFYNTVWFNTTHGIVSGLYDTRGVEQNLISAVLDESGRSISKKSIRVFRQDESTKFIFDKPVYTLHVLVSEYEHVVLFENYSVDTLLIYDPFLGQKTTRIFLEGEKQADFTGRLDFGGHFLLGDKMKKNIERSVQEIQSMYDSNAKNSVAVDRARSILGFNNQDYFMDRGTTPTSEFRFWQGSIANKGTNLSIKAFVNSASYQAASVDEYWAYKIAEYGDANSIKKTEMYLQPEDCTGEITNYRFLEPEDVSLNPARKVLIDPFDELRWRSYSDLNSVSYIPAAIIAEWHIVPYNVGQLIVIRDSKGYPVRADKFELWNINYIEHNDAYDLLPYDTGAFDLASEKVYYEIGELYDAEHGYYTSPSFERVNHSTIRILDEKLVGMPIKVVAYGPAEKRFSPSSIYDRQTKALLDGNVIWWDPGRGVHNPRAAAAIDTDSTTDPAVYNSSIVANDCNTLKPWGSDKVGTTWWNTLHLSWTPYSDDKIFPVMADRLNRWGTVSEACSIEVYEWVKSDVPPSELATGESLLGEPARVDYAARRRTWWQRPVAWKFSNNPENEDRTFVVSSPDVLKVVGDKAILGTTSFSDYDVKIGTKISSATYLTTAKLQSGITSISGLLKVTSLPKVVVGSTATFECGFTGVSIEVVEKSLKYRSKYLGSYTLSVSGNSISLSYPTTGETQSLGYVSSTATATYNFDKFGIVVTTNSIVTTLSITLRSYVTVEDQITIPEVMGSPLSTLGWIAWNDPTTNPVNGVKPPLNKYEPVIGDWSIIQNLHLVADDIKLRTADKWTWFDSSDCSPYRSTWTDWKTLQETFVKVRYLIYPTQNTNLFNKAVTFDNLSLSDVETRGQVFVNEFKTDDWNVVLENGKPRVNISNIVTGDVVKIKVSPYVPSKKELAFDPTVADTDPFLQVQYKKNYPHVHEILRDAYDGLTINNYYFWVKNKTSPVANKKLSIKQISSLLEFNEGVYAIPQRIKNFDQIDERPNRYAYLSFKNLSYVVKGANQAFLRIVDNAALRDRDQNLKLKPVHEEWKLLRVGQLDKIPKTLWDKLTDTLTATDHLDSELPYSAFDLYDKRNKTGVRYGFDQGQVLTDSSIAIETVKYTILNTKLDKYENGESIPDYISYTGFDVNRLNDYFSTKENIRKFMVDLWRFAKPSQVNEIFFAVLHDAAAKNFELTDLFKTSFISLSDIRTVSINE